MKHSTTLTSILSLILFFFFTNLALASDSHALSLSLESSKQKTNTSDITIVITNESTKALRLLKWNTPLEPILNANLFSIDNNGKKVHYTGRLVKRGRPQEKDYILLQAGESIRSTIHLDDYYDIHAKGRYKVKYKGKMQFKEENYTKQNASPELKNSKNIQNTIEFDYTPIKTDAQSQNKIQAKLTPNYNGCSSSQITIINNAHDGAISISSTAKQDLLNETIPTAAERYVEWFGAPDTSRNTTVNTHFTNIVNALDQEQMSFDCTCTDDYFAYVYPNSPYTIHLCNAFWTASLTGTDSQAGTIVHETSHFTIVAGTADNAYGQSLARDLAISDPDSAVFNADSHEYFSENTPVLSMDAVIPPDPDDYGNVIDDAYLLNYSETLSITGIIDTKSDADVFSFTVPTSGLLSVYTTGSLDTIGKLYDNNSVELAYNDDEFSGEYNFKIDQNVTQGQYFISVTSYGAATGNYTLNINFTPKTPTLSVNPSIISYLLN